jgi:ABC-2 type transport system permease protein
MSTRPNAVPESPLGPQPIAPTRMSRTRPFCWSVRRELWENRSIYIAPLAAAALYMLGFLISLIAAPHGVSALSTIDPSQQPAMLAQPYSHAGMLLMVTAFLVGIFYSVDALHGERRDRSILFWKSLPVSDLTTVLSKACIPLVVLPLVVFTIAVPLQVIMRLLNTAFLFLRGVSGTPLWRLPLFQMELVMLYGLVVLALWHAPMYAWFLLVSGWARRMAILWAVLPLLAISVAEYIAFHTTYIGSMLSDRLFGFAAAAFDLTTPSGAPVDPHFIPLAQLAPEKFLSSPGLWLGLIIAAILLAATVRMRRYREPI